MSHEEIKRQLCEALGIDITTATRVVITIDANGRPLVVVTLRPTSATSSRLVNVLGQLHFKVGS